jgi:UDP-hydrolysing UDP-N-acetyl-D-glucosamine 2-epimerase
MRDEGQLRPQVLVSGAHLLPDHGLTVGLIEADGFPIAARLRVDTATDTPAGVAEAMGRTTGGFGRLFATAPPDLLLVTGDRFEMHAAALAALPFKIPVAHLHGGELSQGAFDDALRHSLTKLCHLHFVSTDVYARRVAQLGEEPWRITVCGAPSLDNLRDLRLLSAAELSARIGLAWTQPPILITFHPVTLEYEQTAAQSSELLAALEEEPRPMVFTSPNADPAGSEVRRQMEAFVSRHPHARLADTLGTQAYFSLMAVAGAMVGNSSSGILEAPSFGLPVVNVGTRQQGRVRGANVLDVDCTRAAIQDGLREALTPAFRDRARQAVNPYDRGGAAAIIIERLRTVPLNQDLLFKRFQDLPRHD